MLLWDANTGEILMTFEGESRRITSVAYSPDETRVVSGSDDGNVILWDVESGQMIRQLDTISETEDRAVLSVDYSPNGRTIIAGFEDGQVLLWDVTSEIPVRQFAPVIEGVGVSAIVFSPDGENAISSMRDGRVLLWRTPSLNGLSQWARQNRAVPELTCTERELYRVPPFCEAESEATDETS